MRTTNRLLVRTPVSRTTKNDIEFIGYKESAKILGLSPSTVANGGAGTRQLQHRLGPEANIIRYIKSEVVALRDEWLSRAAK